MTPPPRLALVASTRTGSSWLASLLDSHPAVRFHGELFNLEHASPRALRAPLDYLDEQLASPPRSAVGGFRLLQHQARPEYVNDFLAEMDEGRRARTDWRAEFPVRPVTEAMLPALAALWDALPDHRRFAVIHLQRRNLLRQRLSHERLMAESRADWRGTAPDAALRLDATHLVERFEAHSRTVDELRRRLAPGRTLEVFYEDLLAEPTANLARILAFLELPAAPLQSAIRRRPQRPLREALANYDEVARALAGTRWAALLDEA
jgi:LPS sulfotransferase NodH